MTIQNKNKYNSSLFFSKISNLKSGYSIIEILVYLAIFTALSIVVINSFIVILFSFNTTNMNRQLIQSSTMVMERMSREIRQANSIDIVNSTIGTDPGFLQLKNNNSPDIIFKSENQELNLYQDGVLVGNLLGQNITVENLIFRRIPTTNSEAVRIEITLSYLKGQNTKTVNLYNTIVLRGGY